MSQTFQGGRIKRFTVQILSGQSLAAVPVGLGAGWLLWIEPPAGIDGTVMSFRGGDTLGAPIDLRGTYGEETLMTIAPGTRQNVSFDDGRLMGHEYLWLRTGTSASPTPQTADRAIKVAAWDPY
jgi:hypothetical protein